MKLRVIGTGSKGNAYLLNQGCDFLMLDAGVSAKQFLTGIDHNITALDGVLISHAHQDHSKLAKMLVANYVDTAMPQQTADILGLDAMYYPQLHTNITNKTTTRFKNWYFKAFELKHDTDNVGYYITHSDTAQKIFYVTDSGYVETAPVGVNVLIVECNYIESLIHTDEMKDRFSRVKSGHMSLERLLSYLKKIDTTKLTHVLLIHLSDTNSDESQMLKSVRRQLGSGVQVYAAHNCMEIDLEAKNE